MRFQRWMQTLCLLIFVGLLLFAAKEPLLSLQESFVLRLDLSIVWITWLSNRQFLIAFLPAVVLVLLTLILGRFFCGHICPMGTTLDLAEKLLVHPKGPKNNYQHLRFLKYFLLIGLTTSALLGVSYVFWLSPLSLSTRLYGLVLTPVLDFLLAKGQQLLLPIWEWLDLNRLIFWQSKQQQFSAQFFVLFCFIVVFMLGRLAPRFWCRYLCPAGALLALCSKKPLVRRNVSNQCINCGKCSVNCPMGAIELRRPEKTLFEECIVCLNCEKICQEGAVRFARPGKGERNNDHQFLPGRRQMIVSGLIGAGTAAVSLTGLRSPSNLSSEGKVLPPGIIRPPAALPEMMFLASCVRCGECMVACPTNTLQPLWFETGMMGMFSPAMVLRKGFCDPDCHRCAEVCPTSAIKAIPMIERQWAKTGTAVIHRQKCLAWEHEQKCMVCDEVCPFDAIHFSREKELSVTVPKVSEVNCTGCGYCEYHCPVQNSSAIVVSPMNAIRIAEGSFQEKALKAGFHFSRSEKTIYQSPSHQRSPSGSEAPPSIAPGFEIDP